MLQLKSDEPKIEGLKTAAATGAEIADEDKTDGIPNYMITTSGTVTRLAEAPDSATAVQDNGVQYDADRLVTIMTSDVIDMVQQQGGAAEQGDHLGENIMVDGMVFDNFKADDTFDIQSDDGAHHAITLKIVEPRPSTALELGQLGDDATKRQSIASILSLAPGTKCRLRLRRATRALERGG